ncbi:MAG TPA: IreB family regulatory phosphoprotein [Bacillota bacterium]|nr:IreB family regulatory phosphoprotein [Bacillota bacterium]
MDEGQNTVLFNVEGEEENQARKIMLAVYQALKEKGYNPLNQLVGYLISGDPAYVTSHNNARSLIRQVERDELLEELLKNYLAQFDREEAGPDPESAPGE